MTPKVVRSRTRRSLTRAVFPSKSALRRRGAQIATHGGRISAMASRSIEALAPSDRTRVFAYHSPLARPERRRRVARHCLPDRDSQIAPLCVSSCKQGRKCFADRYKIGICRFTRSLALNHRESSTAARQLSSVRSRILIPNSRNIRFCVSPCKQRRKQFLIRNKISMRHFTRFHPERAIFQISGRPWTKSS